MEENCDDIHSMADRRAGPWPGGRSIDDIYRLAQRLLSSKSSRPLISAVSSSYSKIMYCGRFVRQFADLRLFFASMH